MPPEITTLAPPWAVGLLVIMMIILHVGRMLAEASATWAKILGPLGRRWRDRGLRRQQERLEERDTRLADLQDAVRLRDSLAESLDHCRTNQEELWAYLVYDAEYHWRLAIAAADSGCDLPPHTPYLKWKEQRP